MPAATAAIVEVLVKRIAAFESQHGYRLNVITVSSEEWAVICKENYLRPDRALQVMGINVRPAELLPRKIA